MELENSNHHLAQRSDKLKEDLENMEFNYKTQIGAKNNEIDHLQVSESLKYFNVDMFNFKFITFFL